jgi:hypothetical protein
MIRRCAYLVNPPIIAPKIKRIRPRDQSGT